MIIRLFFAGILFIGFNNPVLSQDEVSDNDDNCTWCKDGKHQTGSPYKIGWKEDLPFIVVGAGMATAGVVLKYTNDTEPYTTAELETLDRNDVNAFDRGATYNWDEEAAEISDYLFFTTLILPAALLINHHTRSDIGPLLLMGLEVASINYGITSGVKNLVNRTRPYVYNTDLSDEQRTDSQSRVSFFSGHTSVTASFSFFFAKVVSDYHPDMKKGVKLGIWAFAAAIPATTGYLRVKSGKHYRTDVITGYAIGAFTGWLIPHLHLKKNLNKSLSVYPVRIYGVNGIGLTFKL
jgi:membrane-associated phospholipid phosphatase